MEYEVTAVETVKLANGGEEVVAIGNNRSGWRLTAASAIHRINSNQCVFYVADYMRDRRAYLCPAPDSEGRVLLRSVVEGSLTNHLPHLPSIRNCDLID